jgi:iron complex transport system substrate-binding protein
MTNIVVVAGYPDRIISLAPSITESLFLLGAGDKIVGVTMYCEYPAEAKKKDKIGSLLNVNIEKIVSLRPDIVIGAGINRLENVEKIRKLNIKVQLFENDNSFDSICKDFLDMGRLVGKEKVAVDIITQSKTVVTTIKNKLKSMKNKTVPKIFWECGASPLITVTQGTFIDELIAVSGGMNIAHGLSGRYVRYSKEEVLKQNPDIIIIIGMGVESYTEKKNWEKYKSLSAVKHDRIYIIEDAHAVAAPNPVTFSQAVKQVSLLIHPEIKDK